MGRAHGAIYRSESSGFRSVIDFFAYELPAVFRQTFAFTAVAFLLTVVFAGIGAAATAADENFAEAVVPGVRAQVIAHENWTQKINEANPIYSAVIQQNNIQVCAMAFGGGLLLGLGTLYILMVNGLMLGVVITLCLRYKFYAILIFMVGHGVLELSAIFISGGAGFLVASALIAPGDLSRVDALLRRGRQAVILLLGCAVMLVFAGTIEGFVSPSSLHYGFKIGVALTTGALMVLYYLKPDRRLQFEGRPLDML